MISIGSSIQSMQIHKHMGRIHRRSLYKLQSSLDRDCLAISEPRTSHGLMSIGSINARAGHTVTPMLWGKIIMNSDGSTNDRMPSRQWQIRVGEKFDRIFEVTLAAANLQPIMLVYKITDLATVGNMFIGALTVKKIVKY